MDILRPPLAWVEGRCYRLNHQTEYTVTAGYTGEFDDEFQDDCVDKETEADLRHPLEETKGGYKARVEVASAFFPQIIGKGGQTKVRLERDTKTKIIIPRKGEEGDIIISGSDRRGVITACNRLDVMVLAARNKQPFTHFLSLPVNSSPTQEYFHQFKTQVLEMFSHCRGVEESIFQTNTLLHITVGTMALLDDRERRIARDILEDCKEQIIVPLLGESPFKITIAGLEIMNDDPSEVDVLYGRVGQSGELQEAANKIIDRYVASGLMRREYDNIKFHVTLMNTLFRRDKSDVGDSSEAEGTTRESFDAREILETLGGYSFGDVEIHEIHLSQRRAGRRTAAGYYLPSTILSITTCG